MSCAEWIKKIKLYIPDVLQVIKYHLTTINLHPHPKVIT